MIHHIEGGYANTYLIEGESGLAAVDVGSNRAAEKIRKTVIERYGGGGLKLKIITATHFHIDHVGGIDRLKEFFPEAEVYFSARVKNYLTGKEKLAIPPLSRWLTGLIPVAFRIGHGFRNFHQSLAGTKVGIPLPIIRSYLTLAYEPQCELAEEFEIPFLPGWRIIETPGHTPDSICFYNAEEKVLLSGDTILNMEGSGELNRFCCSIRDIQNSFLTLSSLSVETLYPGHGTPIIDSDDLLKKVTLFSPTK